MAAFSWRKWSIDTCHCQWKCFSSWLNLERWIRKIIAKCNLVFSTGSSSGCYIYVIKYHQFLSHTTIESLKITLQNLFSHSSLTANCSGRALTTYPLFPRLGEQSTTEPVKSSIWTILTGFWKRKDRGFTISALEGKIFPPQLRQNVSSDMLHQKKLFIALTRPNE